MALTPREYEVLRLRASGLPTKAVAHRLGSSEQTVKNQSVKAFAKLGVGGLVEAMNALGWVSVTDRAEHLRRTLALERAAYLGRVAAIVGEEEAP